MHFLSIVQRLRSQKKLYFRIKRRQRYLNIPLIARQWQLSPREQDIVRLLLEDRSNKEISHLLRLSINTIKAYLKLLMRKLNVSSRAGIVSYLLTKQPVAQVNED